MTTNNDLAKWSEAQEYSLNLDISGKIIDFLDTDKKRANTPEERVRQRMLQVLHFELGYPKELLAAERSIKIGRENKRGDILIFWDKSSQSQNNQGKIRIIGETKSPDEHEPDGQLLSYISATSAEGGFWTNGDKIFFYRKNNKTGKISDFLGIPKSGQAWDSVGRYKKKDLIQPIDLKVAFRRCHNAIYRSGIDSEDIALDMVRIILAKVEDESSSSPDCTFYITQEEIANPKLLKLACDRVRKLFDSVKKQFADIFNPQEEITASDKQLAVVISYLQQYSLLESPYDVIGTAYEIYVASHLKGERGQYFTNRLVVTMMVKMLNPTEKDVLLDPACGSGGFLISAMNHIIGNINNSKRTASAKERLVRNVFPNIFGVDTTPKLVKVAKTNMLLSKDGHSGIIRGDSLGDYEDLPEEFSRKAGKSKPTIILTNPPFGSGHELRIRDPKILAGFVIGRTWRVGKNNSVIYSQSLNSSQGLAPEILFLERCINWVKPGGRIGIVMAKGQLDNRDAFAVRDLIFKECKVLAVVNLHEDTFEPFTGAKASVIFLERKRTPSDSQNYKIFMALSNKVGQTSRGEPIFKRDATRKAIIKDNLLVLDEDLSDIADAYKLFQNGNLKESAFHFSIKASQIKKDTLSLNPVQYLPKHNAALKYVLSLKDDDRYEVQRLGDIADVFNGPRFKRPYAEKGVTSGPTIRKYYTGTALTQLHSENLKYLDTSKANKQTKRHLEALTIKRGYILVSDSGTLGRVTYALKFHDGHLATNNLIRIVIKDEMKRGYVYQFLKDQIGQSLLLKNAYGTNQEHLEPDVVADIPIPIPKDPKVVNEIGKAALNSINSLEKSIEASNTAHSKLGESLPSSSN